jgi:hypothetical protein
MTETDEFLHFYNGIWIKDWTVFWYVSLWWLTLAFTTKETMFLSLLSIFLFWMVTLLCSHYMALSISQLVSFTCIYNTSMTVISWQQKNFYTKGTAFINYWKHSQNCITVIKILYRYNSTWKYLIKKGISHPCFTAT